MWLKQPSHSSSEETRNHHSFALCTKMGARMMLLAVILMVMSNFKASSLYTRWISIDCGAQSTTIDATGTTWYTDDQFITTGENKVLPINANFSEMNTLRFFTSGQRNCYTLPLDSQVKYLIRAGFYYANYDNLLKPPTFDLEIDGMRLTVDTSLSDEPIYYEVIHVTNKESTYICLIQTNAPQVPFISTLEATFIYGGMYRLMEDKKALYLESRINYGANQTVPERFSRYTDPINRIWMPEQLQNYRNLYAGYQPGSFSVLVENNPPNGVLVYAIEANNVSESIFLPIKFHNESVLSAYFVFYFKEISAQLANSTRKLAIYINGQEKNVTQLDEKYRNCVVVSIYPVNVTGTANVTISPAEGTSLPPLLNAMEVYSTMDEVSSSKADKLMHCSLLSLVLLYYAWALLGSM